MEIVKVKAKITGAHALTGIQLEEGQEYDIDRKCFGHEIMSPIGWTPTDAELGIQPDAKAEGPAPQVVPAVAILTIDPAQKTDAAKEG